MFIAGQRVPMIKGIVLIVLCIFPGVSHVLLGRYKSGVVMFFLAAFAFNGLFLMGPTLQPPGYGNALTVASVIILVGLWGYTIYSLISLSFRPVSAEMDRQRKSHFQSGVVDYLKSDLDVAHAKFEEMAAIDADDPDTQFHLGMIYKRKGMAREAKKAFRKSLTLDPDKWAWEIRQELKDL